MPKHKEQAVSEAHSHKLKATLSLDQRESEWNLTISGSTTLKANNKLALAKKLGRIMDILQLEVAWAPEGSFLLEDETWGAEAPSELNHAGLGPQG